MIYCLNSDLVREYSHWNFYIHAAAVVKGPHREELAEFFREQAASEMKHIEQFKRLILGLGGTPTTDVGITIFITQPNLSNPNDLLKAALEMEEEVVENYVKRIDDADLLQANGGKDKVDGKYIELFLEDQIMDSRTDADHIREMIS